jgi:hypothetical protein
VLLRSLGILVGVSGRSWGFFFVGVVTGSADLGCGVRGLGLFGLRLSVMVRQLLQILLARRVLLRLKDQPPNRKPQIPNPNPQTPNIKPQAPLNPTLPKPVPNPKPWAPKP